MALAEVETLDAHRYNVLGHLRILHSKTLGLKARVAENVENSFFAFCRRLTALLPDLAAARQRDIDGALHKSMDPLREIFAAFRTELVGSSPNIDGNSSANQIMITPYLLAFVLTWRVHTAMCLT